MKTAVKEVLGWGFLLWLVGYLLGIILFMLVPAAIVGWMIMPVGTLVTLWVLYKKIKSTDPGYYLILAVVWTLLAIILDYFLLVRLFKPADGYYKPDVFLYYLLTFSLPVMAGLYKKMQRIG